MKKELDETAKALADTRRTLGEERQRAHQEVLSRDRRIRHLEALCRYGATEIVTALLREWAAGTTHICQEVAALSRALQGPLPEEDQNA